MMAIKKSGVFVWLLLLLVTTKATRNSVTSVFEGLIRQFRSITDRTQFAVLYMSGQVGELHFLPEEPHQRLDGSLVLFPERRYSAQYRHNFAAARTDHRGLQFGSLLADWEHGRHVHSEEILLNVVYPEMINWFSQGRQDPMHIYIYTYLFPCTFCMELIEDLVESYPQHIFHVAFSEYEVNDPQEHIDTLLNREPHLSQHLDLLGGDLRQIPGRPDGLCFAQGHSSRSRRAEGNFEECTQKSEIVLHLDFENGKAVVSVYQKQLTAWSWVGLFDKDGKRQTWNYVHTPAQPNTVRFNAYMSEGFEVRLFQGYSSNPIKKSFSWDKCGFEMRKLNNVPTSYGDVWMWLSVNDGYPEVHVKFSKGRSVTDSSDWIVLQNEDDAYSNDYDKGMWQWVTKFDLESKNTYRYNFGYRLYSRNLDGFRVKYVYNNWGYKWESNHDNATPFWTPNGCIGTGA